MEKKSLIIYSKFGKQSMRLINNLLYQKYKIFFDAINIDNNKLKNSLTKAGIEKLPVLILFTYNSHIKIYGTEKILNFIKDQSIFWDTKKFIEIQNKTSDSFQNLILNRKEDFINIPNTNMNVDLETFQTIPLSLNYYKPENFEYTNYDVSHTQLRS